MGKKPFRALLSVLALSVILTVLYAGDKRKPPPVSSISTETFSGSGSNLRTTDLVFQMNHDPRYANLSPSEKVKVITRAFRKDKENRGIPSVQPRPDHKVKALSGKRKLQWR
ncbi:MAG: hypothetical protein ACE5G1_01770 [bacterium]